MWSARLECYGKRKLWLEVRTGSGGPVGCVAYSLDVCVVGESGVRVQIVTSLIDHSHLPYCDNGARLS